jgi:hypothetical protein
VQKANQVHYQINQTVEGKKESSDNIKMEFIKYFISAHYLVAQKVG